jgi:hypothetical protein
MFGLLNRTYQIIAFSKSQHVDPCQFNSLVFKILFYCLFKLNASPSPPAHLSSDLNKHYTMGPRLTITTFCPFLTVHNRHFSTAPAVYVPIWKKAYKIPPHYRRGGGGSIVDWAALEEPHILVCVCGLVCLWIYVCRSWFSAPPDIYPHMNTDRQTRTHTRWRNWVQLQQQQQQLVYLFRLGFHAVEGGGGRVLVSGQAGREPRPGPWPTYPTPLPPPPTPLQSSADSPTWEIPTPAHHSIVPPPHHHIRRETGWPTAFKVSSHQNLQLFFWLVCEIELEKSCSVEPSPILANTFASPPLPISSGQRLRPACIDQLVRGALCCRENDVVNRAGKKN